MENDKRNGILPVFSMSGQEERLFQERLFDLLKLQAKRFNSIDSTSMTIERAQDLLASLVYTISVTKEEGITSSELLSGNLSFYLSMGQKILDRKRREAQIAWQFLCGDPPAHSNVFYRDTVMNLGSFFKKYDFIYRAHHIPTSIDYWLMVPVSEELKGVSFLSDYLFRLQLENDLLACFDSLKIKGLYVFLMGDYEESFFNLCEPVFYNAVGLSLIGADIKEVSVRKKQQEMIRTMLSGRSKEEISLLVRKAVSSLLLSIGLCEEEEEAYFQKAAQGLIVRLCGEDGEQKLSHIFVSFEKDVIE